MTGLIFVVIIVSGILYYIYPYLKIMVNNYIIDEVLNNLKKDDYQAFSNVIVKNKEGDIVLDHLIISKFGIFVINKKIFKEMYSYLVGGEEVDNWRYKIRGRVLPDRYLIGEFEETNEYYNPIQETKDYINILSELIETDIPNCNIKYIPIIIIIPEIKVVNVARNDDSKAKLIFASSLRRIINEYGKQILSQTEMETIIESVKMNSEIILKD